MKLDVGINPVPDTTIAAARIDELESALLERDQLVQMLTEQLEQAADQLDRLHRTGAGRASGKGHAGAESQHSLVDHITQVLNDWGDSLAGQTLSRIEDQVAKIHDFLKSGSAPPTSTRDSVSERFTERTTSSSTSTSSKSATLTNSAASASSATPPRRVIDESYGWEAIKAAMLANESLNAPPPPPTEVKSPIPAPAYEAEPVASEPEPSSSADTPPLPDPPAPIVLESATLDQLRQGLQLRDDYIALLIRKLTSQTQPQNLDWDQLREAPLELRSALEALRDHWQSHIRTAQVDLALQRARLAREESRLKTQTDSVERQQRQTEAAPVEAKPGTTNRRWMNFLQRPGN